MRRMGVGSRAGYLHKRRAMTDCGWRPRIAVRCDICGRKKPHPAGDPGTQSAIRPPSIRKYRRPVLITGGAGFIGSNLAERLLDAGRPVMILDNLSRAGVEHNVRYLCDTYGDLVEVYVGDTRNKGLVETLAARLRGHLSLGGPSRGDNQPASIRSMISPRICRGR